MIAVFHARHTPPSLLCLPNDLASRVRPRHLYASQCTSKSCGAPWQASQCCAHPLFPFYCRGVERPLPDASFPLPPLPPPSQVLTGATAVASNPVALSPPKCTQAHPHEQELESSLRSRGRPEGERETGW